MRLIPQVRELCARAAQPRIRQLTIGLVLLGPMGLWIAGAPATGAMGSAFRSDSAATASVAGGEADEVARAWAARTMESQRQATISKLASEFKVEPPLAEEIHDAAVSAQIDPKVAFGLVRAESSFRTSAVSPVGAVGLTQMMPATARWLEPGTTRKELMQPEVNLRVGFKYLRRLMDQYDGNQKLALTAFNRGPGTVDRLVRRGRNPDNGYAEKVLTGHSKKHVSLMNAKFGKKSTAKGKHRRS